VAADNKELELDRGVLGKKKGSIDSLTSAIGDLNLEISRLEVDRARAKAELDAIPR
jgi:hypothetical protein